MHVSTSLKPFLELAQKGHCYRLDWLGGLCWNFGDPSNPLLECFFTPIVSSEDGVYSDKFTEQIRAGIAVGYLPGLFLGQVYKDGTLWQAPNLRAEEVIELDVDLDAANTVEETTYAKLNSYYRYNPVLHPYSSATHAGLKRIRGQLVATSHRSAPERSASRQKPLPFFVLLPEIEIIRYYYVTSEYISKRLFTGFLSKENWFESVFCRDGARSVFLPELNVARLVSRFRFPASDAPVLGRIAFDSSQRALRGAQRIANSMAAQRLNVTSHSHIAYPRTDFPFSGKTTLTLSGIRRKIINPLSGKEEWVFRAHRILSCSAPFPFGGLSYFNGKRIGANAPRKPKGAVITIHHPGSIPPNLALPTGSSISTEPPSKSGLKLTTDLATREYLGLADIPILHEGTEEAEDTPTTVISKALEKLLNASTGDPTSGQSSSAQQKIRDWTFDPIILPRGLDLFLEALLEIEKLMPKWKIATLALGKHYQGKHEAWISTFPAMPCETRHEITRQFSYIDPAKEHSRRFICAKVTISLDQSVYVMEAERRPDYPDEIPIALFRGTDYRDLTPIDFDAILIQSVKKATWAISNDASSIVKDKTYHGRGAECANDLAHRIIRMIERNI